MIYSFEKGVTCMSVHPLNPYYLAVGLGDGTVSVMDRRMSGVRSVNNAVNTITPRYLAEQAIQEQYKPFSSSAKPFKITCTQFNPTGSELLVSYSEDYVYLFNSSHMTFGAAEAVFSPPLYRSHCYSTRSSGSVEQKSPQGACLSSEKGAYKVSNASGFVPPMRRLRLRGDWSDTGPEARPNDTHTSNSNRFMTRMSSMFSRWIDQGYSSESSEGRSNEHQQAVSEPTTCTSQSSQNRPSDCFGLVSETDHSSLSLSSHSGLPASAPSSNVASLSSTPPLQWQHHSERDQSQHIHVASNSDALISDNAANAHSPGVTDQDKSSGKDGACPSLLSHSRHAVPNVPSTSNVSS